MKRLLVILLLLFALSACMRSVDGYNSDPYIVAELSAYGGKKISVADFEAAMGEGVINQCRGYSIITTPGEGGLAQYIQEAFITELERANLYSPDSPVVLGGKVTQISLSTLTTGEWIIKMTLTSNNGRSLSVREQMHFKTNIVGQSACQVASDTFSYAVQNVIRKLVTSPGFSSLLEPSNYPKKPPPSSNAKQKSPSTQPAPAPIAPQEVSAYSPPASVELAPLEVSTASPPVSADVTPLKVPAQPIAENAVSDCSVEKQLQKQGRE